MVGKSTPTRSTPYQRWRNFGLLRFFSRKFDDISDVELSIKGEICSCKPWTLDRQMSIKVKILTRAEKQAQIDQNRIKSLEKLFVKKRDDMLAQRLSKTPLSQANRHCILGDEIRLKQDIEFGHSLDARDRVSGRSLLTEAVAAGHFHIVRMLIHDYDVDVNSMTLLASQSALHLAVYGCKRQIASILITYGADVNIRDKQGRTPLHMVRSMALAKLLFKFDVDVFAKTYDEGLGPSAFYLKYVPQDERLEELYNYLIMKENKKEAENRKKLRMEKLESQGLLIRSETPAPPVEDEYKDLL